MPPGRLWGATCWPLGEWRTHARVTVLPACAVQVLAEIVALQQQAAAAQEGGIGRFFKPARPPAAVAPAPALVATS